MGRRTYHYYSRQPFLQPHAPIMLSILPIIPVLCPVPRVPHYSHYYAGILGASLPEAPDCFTITCNVVCELPVTVKWISQNGDTVVNTSTITVSEKRRYYWSSAISIIFNHTLPSHDGKYTCTGADPGLSLGGF